MKETVGRIDKIPEFSGFSVRKLVTSDPKLQALMNEVIKGIDCTVLCGYRNNEEQDTAYANGFSKVKWPNSKHNSYPCKAIDVVPYPLNWNEPKSFYYLAGYIKSVADRLGIKIRWGGDFNQDGNLTNDSFVDLPHYELVEE